MIILFLLDFSTATTIYLTLFYLFHFFFWRCNLGRIIKYADNNFSLYYSKLVFAHL